MKNKTVLYTLINKFIEEKTEFEALILKDYR